MPKPITNESESKFMSRCIPKVIEDGTAKSNEQAVAICASMWANRGKKEFNWLTDHWLKLELTCQETD